MPYTAPDSPYLVMAYRRCGRSSPHEGFRAMARRAFDLALAG